MASSSAVGRAGPPVTRTTTIVATSLLVLSFSLLIKAYIDRAIEPSQLVSQEPETIQEAWFRIRHAYDLAAERDGYIPLTYPFISYGSYILWAFLLIPPTSSLHNRAVKWIVLGGISGFYVWVIQNCRSRHGVTGLGIGLSCIWQIIWAATLLIFNDAKKDFVRIVMIDQKNALDTPSNNLRLSATIAKNSAGLLAGSEQAQKEVSAALESAGYTDEAPNHRYKWQPYPVESIWERFEWIVDLFTSLRGPAWNWRISALPDVPIRVQKSLQESLQGKSKDKIEIQTSDGHESPAKTAAQPLASVNKVITGTDSRVSRVGIWRRDSVWSAASHQLWTVVWGCILLDACVTMAHHDKYFWGVVDPYPIGPAYLPQVLRTSPVFMRSMRLLICMCCMWIDLRTVMAIGPLILVAFVGPRTLGANGEAWMYPDHYGSYSNVFRRGLSGWWGGWWHQTFRFAFEAGGKWVASSLLGLDVRSRIGRIVVTVVAFFMSALLHASGSITTALTSRPWQGTFLFFMMQPVGIVGEMAWKGLLKRLGLYAHIPGWMGSVSNFVWVHVWFFFIGPLLTDDFSRGGIFLFEPFPFSILRGLGFGMPGEKFFCWGDLSVRWYSDPRGRWWLNGIAI